MYICHLTICLSHGNQQLVLEIPSCEWGEEWLINGVIFWMETLKVEEVGGGDRREGCPLQHPSTE